MICVRVLHERCSCGVERQHYSRIFSSRRSLLLASNCSLLHQFFLSPHVFLLSTYTSNSSATENCVIEVSVPGSCVSSERFPFAGFTFGRVSIGAASHLSVCANIGVVNHVRHFLQDICKSRPAVLLGGAWERDEKLSVHIIVFCLCAIFETSAAVTISATTLVTVGTPLLLCPSGESNYRCSRSDGQCPSTGRSSTRITF